MFIAHAPAGYLLTRALWARLDDRTPMGAALVASLLPDIDMLWFFLVDGRQHGHHSYLTHLPAFWTWALGVAAIGALCARRRDLARTSLCLWLNLMLHLLLDSAFSGIKWLWPLRDTYLGLFAVPRRYDLWWANFLLHWTFLLELGICGAALAVLWRDRATRWERPCLSPRPAGPGAMFSPHGELLEHHELVIGVAQGDPVAVRPLDAAVGLAPAAHRDALP